MLSKGIRILDGGLSSALEEDGHKIDGDPLWTARLLKDNPDAIMKVHTKFLESGADILITSSYQASIDGFMKYSHITKLEAIELIKKSVHLAKEAIENYRKRHSKQGKEIFVGGSVGPYGACLADGSEYSGSYVSSMTRSQLQSWHRPRIEALLSEGVDFLVIETIPSLQEALCILDLLKNEFPDAKAWVTFSCKDGLHTNHGEKYSHAVFSCFNANPRQLIGIGVNCSSPRFISSLLEEATASLPSTSLPHIIYPNSGGWYNSGTGWSKDEDAQLFTETQVKNWINLGTMVIGGCCQVLPSDIEALCKIVKSLDTKL